MHNHVNFYYLNHETRTKSAAPVVMSLQRVDMSLDREHIFLDKQQQK
jgi:hypothetical protein